MTDLIRYDAACRALAEAKAIDEVKDLHDKTIAMQAYARQAKNKDLEIDAAEIRMRAERRLGEMIRMQKETVGLAPPGPKPKFGSDMEPNRTPTLAEAGIDKKLSSRAQKMAAVPEAEFEGMLGDWRDRIATENERVTTNLLRQGEKAKAREDKFAALNDKACSFPDGMRFPVIYADPPWRFEPYSRETGMDRAADNHYPTMTVADICELKIPALDDAVLFLWATVPMLPDALHVMDYWDFEYKSHLIWVKNKIGTGYWNRNKHELLLIGRRGSIPAPSPGTQPPSTIAAPVEEHSRKPEVFYDIIEELFPDLPRLELFARMSRDGWAAWGNEIDKDAHAGGHDVGARAEEQATEGRGHSLQGSP